MIEVRSITSNAHHRVFHIIDRCWSERRWVAYSSYGSKIVAITESNDRGFAKKKNWKPWRYFTSVQHTLIVNPKRLFDTVTKLYLIREYRLRQTMQRICDSFTSGKLDSLHWAKQKPNIAGAMTRYGPKISATSIKLTNARLFTILDRRPYS